MIRSLVDRIRGGARDDRNDGEGTRNDADGATDASEAVGGGGVEVDGVSVSLGGQEVLRDVSLSVPSGSLVGLVGPNGAGKTTLLRTVNATLTPDAGRVLVGGEDVHSMGSRAVSRRVATVPQDTVLSFEFSVRQVVAMGRHPHRPRFGSDPDPGAVDRAMERVGVAEMADRSVGEVSGGERQRVMLARALAQDAPAMVLDEPTASLDVNHQVETLELVADLAAEGRTVVAAIHDLNLAARYCDGLALLSEGAVIAHGDPESVLTERRLATAFGAEAVVSENPVTESVLVTALGSELDADGSRGDTSATPPTVSQD